MNQRYRPDDSNDIWESENIFYLKSPPARIAKLLAHYELYREIVGVPGSIVECGVYKGASLMRFATFRRLLENDDARAIYGLDVFGAFPSTSVAAAADRDFIREFENEGGVGIGRDTLLGLLRAKGFANVHLIEGDILNTAPALTEANPHLRIALLHLDVDVYEPTKCCLDIFFSHMSHGGLILIDDYNAVEGATRAADEICAEYGLRLRKCPFYNVPAVLEIA